MPLAIIALASCAVNREASSTRIRKSDAKSQPHCPIAPTPVSSKDTLAIISGTGQVGSPDDFVSAPLVVELTDASGNPITGSFVRFRVAEGDGLLQASSGAKPGASTTCLTDKEGNAQMYFRLPNRKNYTSRITVLASSGSGGTQVSFTESSDDGTRHYWSPFAPSAPTGIVNGNGALTLNWTLNSDNETKVLVQHQKPDGSWERTASLPPGTTVYTVESPQPGTYRIFALLPGEDPGDGGDH